MCSISTGVFTRIKAWQTEAILRCNNQGSFPRDLSVARALTHLQSPRGKSSNRKADSRGKGNDANSPINLSGIATWKCLCLGFTHRLRQQADLQGVSQRVSFSGCSYIILPGFKYFGLQGHGGLGGIKWERKKKHKKTGATS